MENRTHAIIAACFLVVLTAVIVIIFLWLSSGPNEPLIYRIVTRDSVAGLSPQSKVEFKGLPVGHVTHVGFDPNNHAQVVIDFRVRKGTYITHATYAVLTKHGITGGEVLELKLGKGSSKPLATSAKHPAHIPLHKSFLAKLKASASKDMKAVQAILQSTKKLLNTNNRKHLAATIKHMDKATAKLVTIEKQLEPVIQQMPGLMKSAHKSLKQSHALLANANQLVTSARGPVKKIGKVEDSVQHLTRKLDTQTVPDVSALSRSLMRTSRELQQLIHELKTKPQSVIFGPPKPPPGPGEPGFQAHGKQGDGHD